MTLAFILEMVWAVKRPSNESLTGLFAGPLTALFCLLFLNGPPIIFKFIGFFIKLRLNVISLKVHKKNGRFWAGRVLFLG